MSEIESGKVPESEAERRRKRKRKPLQFLPPRRYEPMSVGERSRQDWEPHRSVEVQVDPRRL